MPKGIACAVSNCAYETVRAGLFERCRLLYNGKIRNNTAMAGEFGLNVSADPRLIKQILLNQWLGGADPLAPGRTAPGEEGSLFGMLLSQLMDDSSAEDAGFLDTTAGTGAVMPLSAFAPAALSMSQLARAEDPSSVSAYDDLIFAAAAKYSLDPALIKGVIQTESSFHPQAVSAAGAKGLMQLLDDTARGLGVTDPFDPAQNIDGGTRFLSYLLRKYDGNVLSALAAYNAGPGRVDRLGLTTDAIVRERFDELPEETQGYIRKVLEAASRWSGRA